jgi:hypothetical protein
MCLKIALWNGTKSAIVVVVKVISGKTVPMPRVDGKFVTYANPRTTSQITAQKNRLPLVMPVESKVTLVENAQNHVPLTVMLAVN